MRSTLTLLAFLPLSLLAQTNWPIEVGGSLLTPNNLPYYSPQVLVIEVGDIVTWSNVSGTHNVYGELNMFPNNPEGFSNSSDPMDGNWTFPRTFTIPGVYDYHCTGSFQGQNHSTTQFGSITVLDANSIEENSPWGMLSLYPVPANDVLNVGIGTNARLNIAVYGSDGSLVLDQRTVANGPIQLDTSNLHAGLYIIRMVDDEGQQLARQFIVQ